MTFTYNVTPSTDLDLIRLTIGDNVEDTGVKPNGTNYSDEEINFFLSKEGNNPNKTVARLYENLATLYATYVDTKIGSRDEKLSKVADNYIKLAAKWRDDYGYGDTSTALVTGFVTRVDGYSDDITAGEQ